MAVAAVLGRFECLGVHLLLHRFPVFVQHQVILFSSIIENKLVLSLLFTDSHLIRIQPLEPEAICEFRPPSSERCLTSPGPRRRNCARHCGSIRQPLRRRSSAGSKDPSGRRCRTKCRRGSRRKRWPNCSVPDEECRIRLGRCACRRWRTTATAVLLHSV